MHISSKDNPKIKDAVALLKSPAERKKQGLFLCEGPTLLEEALSSGLVPHEVFALEGTSERLPLMESARVYEVPAHILQKLCDTKTPQGPVFSLPLIAGQPPKGGPILALDSVADPGNMGTIIRTADALGFSLVTLGPCADHFSPKVVRSAMGSLFRNPPFKTTHEDLAALCAKADIPIFAAVLARDAVAAGDVELKNSCIIVGNEAAGVGQQSLNICHKKIIIPMKKTESLNVAIAAAILMWEAQR